MWMDSLEPNLEWEDDDIYVTCIKPVIDTEMGRSLDPRHIENMTWEMKPEDVASAVYGLTNSRIESFIMSWAHQPGDGTDCLTLWDGCQSMVNSATGRINRLIQVYSVSRRGRQQASRKRVPPHC